MQTVYTTKKGWTSLIPAAVIIGIMGVLAIRSQDWMFVALAGLTILYTLFVFKRTTYTISDDAITVRVGSIYRRKIAIASIKKVNAVFNIINAPATSFYRLEIFYGSHSFLLISPENEEAFVNELQQLNPSIIFTQRNKKQ